MRRGLPLLVHKDNKFIPGLLLFAATALLYLTVNHFHIFKPRLLPLTPIDVAVPFVPETVWLYVSEYFYFGIIYYRYRDIENLNRFIYAFFSLLIACVLIFWLWPTTISRPLFSAPANLDQATRVVLTLLWLVDTPANCFPSFHVGSVYLSCFLLYNERHPKSLIFLIWATVISLSTLTLKQHYFADIVSGFALAVILYFVFRRVRFRMPAEG